MVSAKDWDLLPGRFGFEPAKQSEWRDLLTVLRRAVDKGLTPRHDGLTGTVREDVVRIHGGYGCYPQEYMIDQLYRDRLCLRIPTG